MAEGLPVSTIAYFEGIDKDYTRKLVKGIDPTYKPVKQRGVDRAIVRDLSHSHRLRATFADILNKLGQSKSKSEIAALTGLRQIDQKNAINRPFFHDWTLSEMQAVAEAVGLTLEQVITACLCSKPISILLKDTTSNAA